jgi:hypothetical protein
MPSHNIQHIRQACIGSVSLLKLRLVVCGAQVFHPVDEIRIRLADSKMQPVPDIDGLRPNPGMQRLAILLLEIIRQFVD